MKVHNVMSAYICNHGVFVNRKAGFNRSQVKVEESGSKKVEESGLVN